MNLVPVVTATSVDMPTELIRLILTVNMVLQMRRTNPLDAYSSTKGKPEGMVTIRFCHESAVLTFVNVVYDNAANINITLTGAINRDLCLNGRTDHIILISDSKPIAKYQWASDMMAIEALPLLMQMLKRAASTPLLLCLLAKKDILYTMSSCTSACFTPVWPEFLRPANKMAFASSRRLLWMKPSGSRVMPVSACQDDCA